MRVPRFARHEDGEDDQPTEDQKKQFLSNVTALRDAFLQGVDGVENPQLGNKEQCDSFISKVVDKSSVAALKEMCTQNGVATDRARCGMVTNLLMMNIQE